MKFRVFMCILAAAMLSHAASVTVTVQAIMEPWQAGMPAVPESPLLALTGFAPGSVIDFSNTSNCGFAYQGGCGPYNTGDSSADGDFTGGSTGARNGISDISAPWNSLIGVFLDNNAPNLFVPPATLNFLGGNDNFPALAPALRQTFFIGDGLTGRGTGSVQQFTVPAGATRLFLGSMDGFGWFNNEGFQDVAITYTPAQVVPEPSTALMLVGGVTLLALRNRLRRSA